MKSLLTLFFTIFTLQCFASSWKESPELEGLFNNAGVVGTFVLYDTHSGNFVGHNQTRSKVRFIPASTFKILNSLIGLSVEAVKNVDDIIPYGGLPQPFDAWEKDMGLHKLPISDNIQKSVRDIVFLEQGENWQLYGKTGWENAPDSGIGWWVGWILTDDHVYSFALNIDIQKSSDAVKRVELGKASLKTLGVL